MHTDPLLAHPPALAKAGSLQSRGARDEVPGTCPWGSIVNPLLSEWKPISLRGVLLTEVTLAQQASGRTSYKVTLELGSADPRNHPTLLPRQHTQGRGS